MILILKIPCNYCDKTFTQKPDFNQLTSHVQSFHHNVKKSYCNTCDKMFANNAAVTKSEIINVTPITKLLGKQLHFKLTSTTYTCKSRNTNARNVQNLSKIQLP